MSTGLHCFLVGRIVYRQGATLKFGRPGKDGSVHTVAEAQNHDTRRSEKSVAGVHGSVTGIQNKTVMGAWKSEWAQKCNRCMASLFTLRIHGVYLGMGM